MTVDLSKHTPEEIEHVTFTTRPLAIVHCPDAGRYCYVVVFANGTAHNYTVHGQYLSTPDLRFRLKKKKVWRLKPLWQILRDNEHKFDGAAIQLSGNFPSIVTPMLPLFGSYAVSELGTDNSVTGIGIYYFHNSWFEEVEV